MEYGVLFSPLLQEPFFLFLIIANADDRKFGK